MSPARPSVRLLGLVLLILAMLVGAASIALPRVYGTGGAIHVLETSQEVNYPSGVGLSVTAESEAEIVEVRVYYRPAGARNWGYAYADFDPGNRVVATQSIPVQEATYIAPGADIEYFYEIRDAGGKVFRTDREMVEYLDQRIDWRRVSIGPLELVYHDIRDSRVEEVVRSLREDLRRVETLLGPGHYHEFKGVIFNSHSEANAAFPVQSQTTTDHGTFAGYAFPEQRVFLSSGLDRRIITHESAHMMMHDAVGHNAHDLPSWLSEGFASHVEPNRRTRSSSELFHRTPPLRAMNQVSGTPQTIPLFYGKAESVVAYLIEEHGEGNFRRLLSELSRGETSENALLKVYGFDVDGLDRRWAGLSVDAAATPDPSHSGNANTVPQSAERADGEEPAPDSRAATPDTEQQPASPFQGVEQRNEPSPFVFFDVWILSGVALLAVTVVGFRFVYTRLRRNRRENYGDAADWDDWDC